MGVDYYVYVGPYIQVKVTDRIKRKVPYNYTACGNSSCSKHQSASCDRFCSQCGSPIVEICEEVEQDWDWDDIAEEFGVSGQIQPEHVEEVNGDTQIWFPLNEDSKRWSWNLRYETVWEDLSDLDVKEEIEKVTAFCSQALEVIEKVYGTKPDIKWGVIGGAN